jgi:transposase
MRGRAVPQSNFVSLISAEELIPCDHPIRRIKRMVDEILRDMNAVFAAMYSDTGCPSIPPERLLKAKVLQALYSIRSVRQLVERIRTDVLFRWFLDMNLDDPLFDASVFSKNQDRLLGHDVAVIFFNKVYAIATRNKWASDDHFSADGTLIQAWGSMKSFKPKDAPPGDEDDLNGFADFKGKKRSNATHASVTDPDAKLTRKSAGDASRLCYRADALSENRNGLCAVVRVSPAVGVTETQAAADNVRTLQRRGIHPRTMGGDAGFHNETFIDDMESMGITPHPALHKRRSAGGIRRGLAYKLSQKTRKRIEPIFGWGKCIGGLRRVSQVGIRLADAAANMVFATGNLVRLARLEVAYGGRD